MNISNMIFEKIDSINLNRKNYQNQVNQNTVVDDKSRDYEPSKKEILDTVEKMNNATIELKEKISFSYHEKTNRVIVKVVDPETNEVVREIPPRDLIKLLEHIQEYLGILIDESR